MYLAGPMRTSQRLITVTLFVAIACAAVPAAASASCARVPLSDQVKFSGVVLTAEFLPGAADASGALQTPARARVRSYDQGSGPQELDVVTALGARAFVSEGIAPKAGEVWRLYGSLAANGSLGTSLCAGSLLMPTTAASASITAAGVTRSLVAATTSGRPGTGVLPVVKLPRKGSVTLRASSRAGDAAPAQAIAARLIEPGRAARTLKITWSGRSASLTGKLPKLTLGKKGATLVIITREASLAIGLRRAA